MIWLGYFVVATSSFASGLIVTRATEGSWRYAILCGMANYAGLSILFSAANR